MISSIRTWLTDTPASAGALARNVVVCVVCVVCAGGDLAEALTQARDRARQELATDVLVEDVALLSAVDDAADRHPPLLARQTPELTTRTLAPGGLIEFAASGALPKTALRFADAPRDGETMLAVRLGGTFEGAGGDEPWKDEPRKAG